MTDPAGLPLTGGVLLVCMANVCRSPLAEAVLARALPEADLGSAGVRAMTGAEMCAVSAVLLPPGAPHHHVARQLTTELVAGADLVITMEREQRSAAVRLAPGSQGKVFTLREAAGLAGGLAEKRAPLPADVAALAKAMHGSRGLVPIAVSEPPKRRWWSRPVEPEDPLTIVDGHGRSDEEHRAAVEQVEATAAAFVAALRALPPA